MMTYTTFRVAEHFTHKDAGFKFDVTLDLPAFTEYESKVVQDCICKIADIIRSTLVPAVFDTVEKDLHQEFYAVDRKLSQIEDVLKYTADNAKGEPIIDIKLSYMERDICIYNLGDLSYYSRSFVEDYKAKNS